VNWYGSHMEQQVNNGLNEITLDEMARLLKNLGFNTVRMLYGTQMLFEDPTPREDVLRANPHLQGKSSMEVLDYQIETLTKAGLLVIINNHVTVSGWCCKLDDGNALWFNEDWTETQWLLGLKKIAERYRHNKQVIGVDIRNEPREDKGRPGQVNDPHYLVWWGGVLEYIADNVFAVDWKAAATEGAKAVWYGNPDALVFIEGTLGGVDLSQVWSKKMEFGQSCLHSRVVYSIHCYAWTEKWLKVTEAWDFQHMYWIVKWHPDWQLLNKVYGDFQAADTSLDYSEFAAARSSSWGYLKREGLAPVWVGEFGTSGSNNWWIYFVRYLAVMDLDWTYWSIDGIKYPKGYAEFARGAVQPESYGLLTVDYRGMRSGWKMFDLARMLASAGLQSEKVPHPGNCTFNGILNPMVGDAWWRNQRVLSLQQLATFAQVSALLCAFCLLVSCARAAIARAKRTLLGYSSDDRWMTAGDTDSAGWDGPGLPMVKFAPL